jgi:hypothetical protein
MGTCMATGQAAGRLAARHLGFFETFSNEEWSAS